jgi:hypothetical protein
MSQLGVEKIEAVAEALKKLVIAGKKISADGKIGIEDLSVLIALISDAQSIIEAFKGIDEAWGEAKDIDVAEAIKLIQAIHAKIKEIEAAK